MTSKFPEYKQLDLSQINKDVLKEWDEKKCFQKSLTTREGKPSFVFYEGPPSANGMPGIHHVMARAIKDIFCRYKTQKGFHVKRKAGWDTHGLPVELAVENKLGITKEDIGGKISVAQYNQTCREEVMKYTDQWENITRLMGYWVDMESPYITYKNTYIESLWYLLKELYDKKLLYKGYSIQPYSPAAGTGLSTHELNLPGCYKDVKDTTCIALFKAIRDENSEKLFINIDTDLYFLAWTTTPWTLLSNTALAVGAKISYLKVKTINPYSGKQITIILAKELFSKYFDEKYKNIDQSEFKSGTKKLPYEIIDEYCGEDFSEVKYQQLLAYQQPTEGEPFRVVTADFVTTDDGTGIVHIAPSFGADDFRVGQRNNLGALTLVDKQGKVVEGVGEFSGRYVKNSFDPNFNENADSLDVEIVMKLKNDEKLFRTEKYEHSYPHCWRTDKPVLYYPLDSWFIKTTAARERMIELNKTINWQPEATGTGRFGKWLENLVDWNLSRSRYWGTPLPIWVTEDKEEEICIGSFATLKNEIEKSVKAGFMEKNPLANFEIGNNTEENYSSFDPHRPFVDEIILISNSGKKMFREPDLIDVWFDSGAMPYAQLHYPFEHKDNFKDFYPADFIAEGVDQTRGWFFTLHAIAVMLFDSVAFKNIISNGLVLDKNGLKMSKRLGNGVDPFETIEKYGSDPTRWYMITNSPPWDNLKFDIEGVDEVRRKFFGTLYNTYSFFALYANVDGFNHKEAVIPVEYRPEIDRWIISLLNSLIKEVEEHYENYFPTKAGRAIQNFVIENLSNWYVRLNRKRFWGGEYSENKIAAYQTLYTCLKTVAELAAPIAPFFMDRLYNDLTKTIGDNNFESVHLSYFPEVVEKNIDKVLEEKMAIAQQISSMTLGLRRKVNLKVRQPLQKIMIPILENGIMEKIEAVKNIILTEINVKEIEYLEDNAGILVKNIKANFKLLGKKFGKQMKDVAAAINSFTQNQIHEIETNGSISFNLNGENINILLQEVEILSEDIPGWEVASEGKITVALDITITEELKQEGIAREFINRIQNLRKDSGFEVTDKISLTIQKHDLINDAINAFGDYISDQTLAKSIQLVEKIDESSQGIKFVEIDDSIKTYMQILKA